MLSSPHDTSARPAASDGASDRRADGIARPGLSAAATRGRPRAAAASAVQRAAAPRRGDHHPSAGGPCSELGVWRADDTHLFPCFTKTSIPACHCCRPRRRRPLVELLGKEMVCSGRKGLLEKEMICSGRNPLSSRTTSPGSRSGSACDGRRQAAEMACVSRRPTLATRRRSRGWLRAHMRCDWRVMVVLGARFPSGRRVPRRAVRARRAASRET